MHGDQTGIDAVSTPGGESRGLSPVATVAAPGGCRPVRLSVAGLGKRLQRSAIGALGEGDAVTPGAPPLAINASAAPGDFDIALIDMTRRDGPETLQSMRQAPGAPLLLTVGRRVDGERPRDDILHSSFADALPGAIEQALSRLVEQRGRAEVPARTAHDGPQVLVVCDDVADRRQLALALQQLGAQSESVDAPEHALALIATRAYDLVIVKARAQSFNGFRFARELHRIAAARAPRVALLAETGSPVEMLRAAWSRCDSYIVKPASVRMLRASLRGMGLLTGEPGPPAEHRAGGPVQPPG